MNNILNTLFTMKAKNYFLTIILAFSLLGLNAQEGAIIHHVPDTCHVFTGPYGEIAAFFDIDGNGSNDLAFQSFQGDMYSTWLNAVVFADWQMTIEIPYHPIPDSIPIQLDTLQYWEDSIGRFIPQLGNGPCIVKKIFLRQRISDDYYYAWVKTDGGWNQRSVYACVEEFAYCTIPNYPLRWGQTSLTESIDENGSTAFATIHPNPTKGIVAIMGENLKQAEVLNVLGQQVLSVQGKGNELHIDMTALPVGVYFVTVTDEEGHKCVRKVVKE